MRKKGNNKSNQGKGGQGGNQQTQQQLNPALFATKTEYQALKTEVQQVRTNTEGDQRRANWALGVAILAAVFSLLSAAGAIWQAVATQQGADIAAEQVRAKLALSAPRIKRPITVGFGLPALLVDVSNNGQTRADGITVESGVFFLEELPEGPMPKDLKNWAPKGGRKFLSPTPPVDYTNYLEAGGSLNVTLADDNSSFRPSADTIAVLTSGQTKLHYFFRLNYTSRGSPHDVEFCVFVLPDLANLRYCPKWNTSR